MQVENLRTKQKEENSSLFRELCAPVFTFASNNHQIFISIYIAYCKPNKDPPGE